MFSSQVFLTALASGHANRLPCVQSLFATEGSSIDAMHLRGQPEPFARDDVQMEDAPPSPTEEINGACIVVAIDFGTTFSSVALRSTDDKDRQKVLYASDINCIGRFPDDPAQHSDDRKEVPTESWYRAKPDDVLPSGIYREIPSGFAESTAAEEHDGTQWDIPSNDRDDGAIQTAQDAYLWGYSVQKNLRSPILDFDRSMHIDRSKLLLDDTVDTSKIRVKLNKRTKILRRKGYIKKDFDIITDFLARLLQHTKAQLLKYHNFIDSLPLEFVVCVPVTWTPSACRIMQNAVAQAVRRAGLGDLSNESIQNMFIVSEAEAAAACVLTGSEDIQASESFLLLDAGGGTVDAIIYTVERGDPLRLKWERIPTGAKLCGSSILNEHFEEFLFEKLRGEHYLEQPGVTIQGIVDSRVVDFENLTKRSYDVMLEKDPHPIRVRDLRYNPDKGFIQHYIRPTWKEMRSIFMKCLQPTGELMMDQLTLAKKAKLVVKKIILVGGFAASISLQNYLNFILGQHRTVDGQKFQLITPLVPGTSVARGAVLRALRKDDGPARTLKSSYGYLRTEPFSSKGLDMQEAHRGAPKYYDPLDGDVYIKNTIEWFIKKGDVAAHEAEYCFPVSYTLPADREGSFVCKEILYVSDERLESHYKKSHIRNKGAEVAGFIVVDMTFLVTEGHIQPTIPEPGERGRPHYKIEYQLVMKLKGRNLRYEARWPAGEGGNVLEKGQTCIAAAFVSGTC